MKCRFCQNELTAEMLGDKGCGACGGGCRKIHCPYCGETNQVTSEFFDKLLGFGPENGEEKETDR